jgi:hypothetical protein
MSCSFLSLSPGWRWNLKAEDGPHFVKGSLCAFFVAETYVANRRFKLNCIVSFIFSS